MNSELNELSGVDEHCKRERFKRGQELRELQLDLRKVCQTFRKVTAFCKNLPMDSNSMAVLAELRKSLDEAQNALTEAKKSCHRLNVRDTHVLECVLCPYLRALFESQRMLHA